MYSIWKARKIGLFRNFVLAVFLVFVGYMLTATPAAYAGGGYALVFDGVDDYVDAENIYQYQKLSQLTVEFWTWRTASEIWAEQFILGNSYHISYVQPITANKSGFRFLKRLEPVGNIQFRVYEAEHSAGNLLSVHTCPVEEWAHIAGVFNAGRNVMKMYINGVEEVSDNAGGAAHSGVGNRFRIGQSTGGQTCVPGTRVDEVRIWNYVRTPEQIQECMNIELFGSEEGLIGYWKLSEGEGATVFDSSPNQNHGTIAGATWTTEAAPVATSRLFAYHPGPAGKATDVPRDVTLGWTPGVFANTHDVYFGTVFNDVNDADRTNPLGVLASQDQDANAYDPDGLLDFGQTYYWRVDEVNAPPDFTVYKGEVWQFTVEPLAYPIAGTSITATASSQFNANTGPENTINSSGLDANDLHSKQEADIWVSSMTGPQPTWIQYEFDRVYRLHQMWVWNHNTSIEPVLGFGIKDATIEYSSDGASWTTLATVEFARAPGATGYAYNTTVDLSGVVAKYVKITANSNWGGVLPQYGLSEVRFFHIPAFAREPDPTSGATDMDVDNVTLSWRAGREAASHNLYISSDEQAVIDETISPVSIPADSSYANYNTGPLELVQSYYWKVNEVNEAGTLTTWQGDLWNFSTQEYIVVDDFEDYNDFEPDRIFDTWIDGWGVPANGSQVGSDMPPFAEQTIIHSGEQSMPLHYNNTGGATYSEAERTFAAPQNWTEHGVKTLSLWFSGAADSVAGQLYVKVNGSKVTYDGDASNLARAAWQVWNIELASFGVNLQSVTRLSIGIDGSGASGTFYVDDIRLYPYDRQFITPTEPPLGGLIGHWKFDGDTQDYSGLGNHGTAGVTPAAFVAGAVGSNAMDFRGADYVAIDGVVDDITSTDITLSIWVKTTQAGEGELFAANDSASAHPFMLGITGGNPYVNDGVDIKFPPAINDGQWHLLTYVRSGSTGYIYVDGVQRGTYSAGFNLGSVTRWSIGQEWDGTTASDFYTGTLDDARFYDRALSPEEVAWLSGRTTPFDKPF